ncbi:MAG: fluoride efflux transporter CrcB [Flavobacteriales bacterium]|nr:fluoride efflux transporter CrcB [Flavobacteriales bacterium]MCZ2444238.1 fluoride efflux transporter CrcB [Flavobacteriales bacterium]
MKEALIVFVGSGLGGLTRWGSHKLMDIFYTSTFPLTTLLVNIIASFLAGVLVALSVEKNILDSHVQWFLITGFCGGFSTFSTFSEQNIQLLQAGAILPAILYIILSVVLSIACCFLGHQIISTYA